MENKNNMKSYNEIELNRKQSNFEWLNHHVNEGVLFWFMIQSIVNSSDMGNIKMYFQIPKEIKKVKDVCEYIYSKLFIDNVIQNKVVDYIKFNFKKTDLNSIVEELSKFSSFEWGGDYQGSLEKSLVKKYIKDGKDLLNNKENILNETINYLMASKYNYLCSKLTENLFYNHPLVVPTINKIKDVDFFVGNHFWDLKQTILPKGYLDKLKKETNFNLDKVISNVKENPTSLIKWLYENQGEMRFSSENRLFMVFVDKTEYEKSWKLKSDKQKLEVKINNFLSNNYITYDIDFKFKGKNYKTKSSLILIENE